MRNALEPDVRRRKAEPFMITRGRRFTTNGPPPVQEDGPLRHQEPIDGIKVPADAYVRLAPDRRVDAGLHRAGFTQLCLRTAYVSTATPSLKPRLCPLQVASRYFESSTFRVHRG